MISATDKCVTDFLAAWHEAGRASFERRAPNLDYDSCNPKVAHQKKKYIYLDEGSSGVYLVERATGEIYHIKAYGKIDRRKHLGNIQDVTGEKADKYRWWNFRNLK